MEPLPLIGYFPKRLTPRPDWLKAPRVRMIRSASEHIAEGPDDWIRHWKHNVWRVYSTEADARSVVPADQRDQYELHAYRMLPAEFDGGDRHDFCLLPLSVQPLADGYVSLGFDAVSRSCGNAFECSPLSCNHLAEEIDTNPHCLLPDLATAETIALRFSADEPEPGPYYVVEVLKRP